MEKTKNRMTFNILGHSFKISAGTRLDKDFTLQKIVRERCGIFSSAYESDLNT